MKTFFGGIFIGREKLEEADIHYPIKLEYYKRIEENEDKNKDYTKYGISVVKTEYKTDEVEVECKDIPYISDDEKRVEKILNVLKENEVTPIALEDIISDLYQEI